MTTERFANQASTSLSSSIAPGDLTFSVQSVTNFPNQPEFRIRIGQELMLVTGVSGSTWTVTRGIEGTSAASHAAGTAVVGVLTAGGLNEMRAEIEAEDRTASGIRTATTVISVSSATAPIAGQVLTATSGTAADWENPASGLPAGSFSGTLVHGGAQQTLITIPISADTIETIGVDWQAASYKDNLTGYEEVQARRIGTASATLISDALGGGWTETSGVASWSRGIVASGTNVLVNLTPDSSADLLASVRTTIIRSNSIAGIPPDPLAALQAAFDAIVGSNFDFAADVSVHVDATHAGYTDLWTSRLGSHTLINSTDANQPAISTLSDATTPSVNFTGAVVAQYLDIAGSVDASTTFTFYVVFENNSNPAQHDFLASSTLWLFGQSNISGKPTIENASDNAVCASSETQVAGLSIYEAQVNGTAKTMTIFRDGTQRGQVSFTTTGGIGSNLRIGNYFGGASQSFGARANMCRLTHVPSIPSSGDRTAIYTFLRAKYPGLPQSNPA